MAENKITKKHFPPLSIEKLTGIPGGSGMKNNKVVVFTNKRSDFSNLLVEQSASEVIVLPTEEITKTDLNDFDGIAILGGVSDEPLLLDPKSRRAIEEQILKGKKTFVEYVASIGHVYSSPPERTRYERLVYCSPEPTIKDLKVGTLIENQCGMRLKPHDITCSKEIPMLQFVRQHAHDSIEVTDETYTEISDRGLWFDTPENLLICSFQISSFKQSRFGPWDEVKKVIAFIMEWLLEQDINLEDYQPAYSTISANPTLPFEVQLKETAHAAKDWFENAGIILDEGKSGAIEGLGTEIYSDGSQRISKILRADCIGEISLPYLLDYLLYGDPRSLKVSENLSDFVFENYLCMEPGDLFGMMRWTNEAWGVCYQDDVARALIPQLLKCYYLKTDQHLEACVHALRFLVQTTGTDGTRVARTDNIDLTKGKLQELKERPGNFPSAHYNAYYYAALLLAYKVTNIEAFKETAIKGLTTIMSIYPDTIREQSETEEYCRLILPLSWLYWVSNNSEHKAWLYRVTNDLQNFQHQSGAYLEQDTGYKASMRHEMGEGESSLVAKNGDPIVDMLYSNNWLPIGFIQAYWVTGDSLFKDLWTENCKFFINAQIKSENPQINGAWTRAFDVERMEVVGSPADMGWGPWAIESGWTVAEISSGLLMGLLEDQLRKHY